MPRRALGGAERRAVVHVGAAVPISVPPVGFDRRRIGVCLSAELVADFHVAPALGVIAVTGELDPVVKALAVNGEEVRLVHYPSGHTDGDTVVFFVNSNVVHLGDDFFVGMFPFVDLDSGGSVRGLMTNIAALIREIPEDAKIIPGHGPVATLNDLKEYHSLITDSVKIVEDGMKAGKTLEGLKADGLPERFAKAGEGFIKTPAWIETIYRDLSKK